MLNNSNFKNPIILYLTLYILSVIGSNIFLIDTSISPFNIAIVISLFVAPNLILNFSRNQAVILSPLLFLFLIGVLHLLMFFQDFDKEIFKEFFYFSLIPLIFIYSIITTNYDNEYSKRKIYIYSIVIIVLIGIVVTIEILTGFHMPAHTLNADMLAAPSAFFTNPNDLSAVVVIIYFLIVILKKNYSNKIFVIISLLTFYILFVSTSRSIFFIFLMYFILKTILRYKTQLQKFAISMSLYVFFFILIMNIPIIQSNKTIIRSKERITSFLSIISNDEYSDASINIRKQVWLIPFNNPEHYIFGEGFNSEEKILKPFFSNKLSNSHSFFLQLTFYFGWTGVALLLMFYLLIIVFIFTNFQNRFDYFYFVFVHIFVLNIPSSVIKMPVIWFPFFYFIAYITSRRFNK